MIKRAELGRLSSGRLWRIMDHPRAPMKREGGGGEDTAEFALLFSEDGSGLDRRLKAASLFSAQPPPELSDFLTRCFHSQPPSSAYGHHHKRDARENPGRTSGRRPVLPVSGKHPSEVVKILRAAGGGSLVSRVPKLWAVPSWPA